MAAREGIFVSCAEAEPGLAPSIASPLLNAAASPVKKSRKGQGKKQIAAAAIADAQAQLPAAPVASARKRGRPPKAGETGETNRPKHIKKVPEHKRVHAALPSDESDPDSPVPAIERLGEPALPESVAAAEAADDVGWRLCPDSGYEPPFDHDKYKKSSGHKLDDFAHEKDASWFAALFFPLSWWRRIVSETNAYMALHGEDADAFTKVVELKQMIGMLMLHAHFKCPSIAMHWEACSSYMPHLWRPTFNHIMPFKRFQFLCKNLHFVDNARDLPASHPSHDPCFKFRWLLDDLNKTCKSLWQLGKHVSADEGLWVVHSACPLISFCPKPGGSYGVLARMTACAEKYFIFHIHIQDKTTRTLAETLACMCEGLKSGQIIYIDRYYTTMDAVTAVHAKGLGVVATCMDGRFPPAKSEFDIALGAPRGTIISCKKGPICAVKWRDNDDVKCLCNVYGSVPAVVDRMMPDGVVRQVPCPKSMLQFGKFMQGVDRNDQLHSKFYSAAMSSRVKKWTVRVFLSLVDIALANAFILYKDTRTEFDSALTHSQFWIDVADAFIGIPKVAVRSGSVPHRLLKFAEGTVRPGSGAQCHRQCVVCALKGVRARTNYGCSTCRVPLHPECAVDWVHTGNPADKQNLEFIASKFA